MKTTITIISILFSSILFSQSGINYKAIIKDSSGALVTNTTVTIEFRIYQNTLIVYSESHTPTTDANGIVILNIGEGTPASGSPYFSSISWGADDHFLNVRLDTGGGLTDLGTTAFQKVPYAIHAENVTGLAATNEGNGVGHRIIGRNLNNLGDIGENAVDVSVSPIASSTYGATGVYSFAANRQTTAQGDNATAFGLDSKAYGNTSTVMGFNAVANGYDAVAMGAYTVADAVQSVALGRYNIGGGHNQIWNPVEPVFEIGNGTNNANRSNALTVLKNGTITAPAFTKALIGTAGDRALVTKEYVDDNFESTGLESLNEGNGLGWRFIGRNPALYGSIGLNAVDLSYSGVTSSTNGASGSNSFATGVNTAATGFYASALGFNTRAQAYASTAIGRYNVGSGVSNSWVATNPLFEIGNGTSDSNRSNALTVLKNGQHLIEADATATYGLKVDSQGSIGADISGDIGLVARATLPAGVEYQMNDIVLGGTTGSIASEDLTPGDDSNSIIIRSNNSVDVRLDGDGTGEATSPRFRIMRTTLHETFSVSNFGDVRLNGAIIHSSDERLKEEIVDLEYGLKEILQLQPKSYFWRDRKQTKKSLGLIAQEVEPIISEIVNENGDVAKTLGVSYTELIPVLIKSIQEQQAIIEEQQNQIDELKSLVMSRLNK